ncbi:hypothetical protein ACFQY8_04840 [Alloscardovia venturai]|uniref:Uncharacterized protein n=1 Tax=Alloscardovia venturai TaxID=1769421 RepID=A0ABW2Y499_9BIFI
MASRMTKETNKKLMEFIDPEYWKRIPFFIRSHATSKTFEKLANEHPDLYDAVANSSDDVPEDIKGKVRDFIDTVFQEKMKKHNL